MQATDSEADKKSVIKDAREDRNPIQIAVMFHGSQLTAQSASDLVLALFNGEADMEGYEVTIFNVPSHGKSNLRSSCFGLSGTTSDSGRPEIPSGKKSCIT